MARKPRREWEAEYTVEYCTKMYPGQKVIYHARLGTFPPEVKNLATEEGELSLLRVYLRWADAIVLMADQVHIIEAKLLPHLYLKGITELELYIRLFKETPEFERWRHLPVWGVLVVPVEDPLVAQMCRARQLRFVVYKPSFWDEFWSEMRRRWTRPPLVKPSEFYGAGP